MNTDDGQATPFSGGPSTFDNSVDVPRNILMKLRGLPLFSQLTEDEFRAVTGLLRNERVKQGALLFEQGGSNTNLYILRRGRAAVRVIDLQDFERLAGFLSVGMIFNEAAFLTGERNGQTVEALEDLSLWYIARDDFHALLDDNPDIESHLVYPDQPDAPLPKLVRTVRQYSWQRAGEIVVLFRKKHPWVFIRTLWPLLIGLSILALLVLPPFNTLLTPFDEPVIIGLVVFLLPYTILQFIDWQNDYFAITDQRVLHRERILFLRDQQDEVPLSKVQDVKIERPSFFTLLFDFGDVTIEASGTYSKIRFLDVAKPDQVGEVLFQQLSRTRVESHASQRSKFRAELRGVLGLGPESVAASAPKVRKLATPPRITKQVRQVRDSLGMLRNTFLPRMRLVQGDTIIYRRHWLRLLETIGVPLLAILIYVGLLIFLRLKSPDLSAVLFSFPLVFLVMIVGLTLSGWLLYRYEDWRNDIYMVTSDRIIDIDRSPFGLKGTSRKEAKLSAVQNVTSNTRGFMDVAFNVGDVVIQTAGGEGQLTFERVYDPRQIQRDIVDRIDAFEASTREKQAAQRRHEMTEWLGIYDDLKGLHNRR